MDGDLMTGDVFLASQDFRLELAWDELDKDNAITVYPRDPSGEHLEVMCNADFNPPIRLLRTSVDAEPKDIEAYMGLVLDNNYSGKNLVRLKNETDCTQCKPGSPMMIVADEDGLQGSNEKGLILRPRIVCPHTSQSKYRLVVAVRWSDSPRRGVLTSSFTLTVVNRIPEKPASAPHPLSLALKEALGDPTFCDVTFLVEERQVPGHKVILTARSEYFRTLLTGRMSEASQSHPVIPILDISYELFTKLMEYVYTDIIEINADNVLSILEAADRFRLEMLKQRCEKYVEDSVTLDATNVCSFLQIADMHTCPSLKRACSEYVSKHIDELERSPQFQENFETLLTVLGQIYESKIREVMVESEARSSAAGMMELDSASSGTDPVTGRSRTRQSSAGTTASTAGTTTSTSTSTSTSTANPAGGASATTSNNGRFIKLNTPAMKAPQTPPRARSKITLSSLFPSAAATHANTNRNVQPDNSNSRQANDPVTEIEQMLSYTRTSSPDMRVDAGDRGELPSARKFRLRLRNRNANSDNNNNNNNNNNSTSNPIKIPNDNSTTSNYNSSNTINNNNNTSPSDNYSFGAGVDSPNLSWPGLDNTPQPNSNTFKSPRSNSTTYANGSNNNNDENNNNNNGSSTSRSSDSSGNSNNDANDFSLDDLYLPLSSPALPSPSQLVYSPLISPTVPSVPDYWLQNFVRTWNDENEVPNSNARTDGAETANSTNRNLDNSRFSTVADAEKANDSTKEEKNEDYDNSNTDDSKNGDAENKGDEGPEKKEILVLRRFSGSCSLRLRNDIKEFLLHPLPHIRMYWTTGGGSLTVSVKIGPDSLWGGGWYYFRMLISPDFPMSPPSVRFLSRIFHPNIYSDGTARIALLEQDNWNPTFSISHIVTTIRQCLFLDPPNRDLLANLYAWHLHKFNPSRYSEIVRDFARLGSATKRAGADTREADAAKKQKLSEDEYDTEELYVSDQSFWMWGDDKEREPT